MDYYGSLRKCRRCIGALGPLVYMARRSIPRIVSRVLDQRSSSVVRARRFWSISTYCGICYCIRAVRVGPHSIASLSTHRCGCGILHALPFSDSSFYSIRLVANGTTEKYFLVGRLEGLGRVRIVFRFATRVAIGMGSVPSTSPTSTNARATGRAETLEPRCDNEQVGTVFSFDPDRTSLSDSPRQYAKQAPMADDSDACGSHHRSCRLPQVSAGPLPTGRRKMVGTRCPWVNAT